MTMNNQAAAPAILRLPDVLRTVGMSRQSVYRMIKAGTFPRQVPLMAHAVGWLRVEIEAWVEGRAAARAA